MLMSSSEFDSIGSLGVRSIDADGDDIGEFVLLLEVVFVSVFVASAKSSACSILRDGSCTSSLLVATMLSILVIATLNMCGCSC